MRRLTTVVLVAAMAFSLTACGRKGRPIPPEGSSYPHTYPNIQFPDGTENQPQGSESTTR